MTNILFLLYAQLTLLAILLIMQGYALFRFRRLGMLKRRRWLRIKVPSDKAVTCRIVEPITEASPKEFLVDDITMAGICFYADRKIEKGIIKLNIKFPFTSFKDAATVWGRVAYCGKSAGDDKFRTGIQYIRKLSK